MRPLDRRLLPHLAPARLALGGVVVTHTVAAGLLVAQTVLLTEVVVSVVGGRSAGRELALLVLAMALRALVIAAGDHCAATASAQVTATLRRRVVRASITAAADRTGPARAGELALLATRGVAAVDPYLTRYLPALVGAVVLPVLTWVAILMADPLSAVIVSVTVPLVPVFAVLVGLATRDRAERQWRALQSLAGHFVDVTRGLPTLVAHRRAEAQTARIREVTERYRLATGRTLRLAFASSAVLELVATLSVALVAVTVGLRLASGHLDLGTALLVLLLAPEVYAPVRRVGAEFHAAAEGTATFESASALLSAAPAAIETSPSTDGARCADPVTVENLVVTFPGQGVPALRMHRLVLVPRTLTAVVGPTGCGKSTLLGVLAGELPASSGTVSTGARAMDPLSATWRRTVATVEQRPWLPPGPVADLLRLSRPEATDGELWQALEQVGLRDHVVSLPGGLAAAVAEDGRDLSAGQRARLALARAIVADRPLVLVDEPSAHLDDESERLIVTALLQLAARATVVVVTHSPDVIAAAAQVVPLSPVPPSLASSDAAAPATAHDAAGERDLVRPPERPPERPARMTSVATRRRLVLGASLGALSTASGVALTVTSGWLITRAAERPPVLMLMMAIVAVRAFGLGRPVLRYAQRLLDHDTALRTLAARRAEVYDVLVPLAPGRLGAPGWRRGNLLTGIVDDVDAVLDDQVRVRGPLLAATGAAGLALLTGTLLLPASGWVLGGWLVMTAATGLLVRRVAGRPERSAVEARAALSDEVTISLQGAARLEAWQAADRAADRAVAVSDQLTRAGTLSADVTALGRLTVTLSGAAGLALTAVLAAPAVAAGRLTGPLAATLLLLPLALAEVLVTVPDIATTAVRTRAARIRLDTLTDTEPLVSDPPAPAPVPADTDLALTGVTAGWGDQSVLRDLDLDIVASTRLAVDGPSGCGKSTLAGLLARHLDPASGTVRMGGADLTTLTLDRVRRRVLLLDDDPHVFSSSVLENVRLARPDASPGEVEAALRKATLGPWLEALPCGLDTLIGEGQRDVSGGERARLGVARALLADCDVLVLDEPTAALDQPTAALVVSAVDHATAGRTVIWIGHDRHVHQHVDRVLDLHLTHTDLLRSTPS